MVFKRTSIAICFLLTCIVPAYGVEHTQGSESAYVLPEVNVYGVADENPATPILTKFGTQFNVVSEDRLKRQNSLDFYDALRNIPGVIFRKQNIIGGQTGASLFVRGRGASHPSPDMTILFDDVPRSGVLYGQALADGIPVYALGGMEIYKYPQPSRFGSGYAMLNFIPKHMVDEGFESKIGFQGGSYGTFAENLSVGAKKNEFDAYVAQSLIRTDGHIHHSKADQVSYYGNFGYQMLENWNLRLMANYVRANTYAPANPLTGKWDGSFSTSKKYVTESSLFTLTLSNEYEKASGYFKYYFNNTNFYLDDENPGTMSAGNSKQSNELYGIRGREILRLWDGGEITLGFDLDKTDLKNEKSYNTGRYAIWDFPDVTMFSPYIALSQTFGTNESWHITPSAGIRGYFNDKFKDKTSPHAGLVMGYSGLDIHFNYARGVNYPSPVILQGFLNNNSPLPPSLDLTSIKPEVADHYEAGITETWSFGSIGATAFYDKGKDRLRANLGWPGFPAYGSPFNSKTSKYRIRGLELNGSIKPIDNLEMFASATWLKVKARGDDNIERSRMPYTPKFALQLGGTWEFLENFALHVDYQYLRDVYCGVSARAARGSLTSNFDNLTSYDRLTNQNVLNAKIEYTFDYEPLYIKAGKIFLSVENIFGKKYASALERDGNVVGYYYMPGRTFMAGFELTF